MDYFHDPIKVILRMGCSPGLVVKDGDSQSKGREFESQHWILDGYFRSNLLQNLFLAKTENKTN